VLALLAGVAVLVLMAVAATVRQWQAGSADFQPAAQDVPGPVLLVPGYGGATSALEELAATLQARGRDATVVQLPGSATGDMREQADALDDAAVAAMERTGAATGCSAAGSFNGAAQESNPLTHVLHAPAGFKRGGRGGVWLR